MQTGAQQVFSRFVLRFFVLSFLAIAMLVLGTGISHAQMQSASAKAALAKTVAPISQNAVAKPSPARGTSTTIQISGRWVIEVRNPDGKVTAHREFENTITNTGMTYLAALLAGSNAPGSLSIMLNGGGSTSVNFNGGLEVLLQPTLYSVAPGPCSAGRSAGYVFNDVLYGVIINSVDGLEDGSAPCVITSPPSSGYASLLATVCIATTVPAGDPPACSTNLTATAPTINTTNVGNGLSASLTLQGTVIASSPSPGYITDVETIFETCSNGSTPTGCKAFFDSKNNGTTTKPGMIWDTLNLFTMASLPSPGIAYTHGQTIAATVTFTFSSPSS
jgi:hypothetical protein